MELDLSAFEAQDTRRETYFESLARVQEITRPGRNISMQNRKRPEDVSSDQKRRPARKIEMAPSRLAQSGGLAENRPARADHSQAKPSDKREEKSRATNCKQRPEPTKGRGGARKFVPWCDRKR